MSQLIPPELPCGNIPTRECVGGCADFCGRYPWMLPDHTPLDGGPNAPL